MRPWPTLDKAKANSHEAEAKNALIFSGQILHFDSIFSKKPKFSVDFRWNLTNFGSKWTLTCELY